MRARRPVSRARIAAWAAFGVAIGIQLVGLYAPSTPDGPGIPGLDKVAHAGMFALVMATGVVAGVPVRALAGVLLAHAVVSEVVQGALLPTRSGDPWDAVADVVGVALGWLVAAPLARRLRRSRSERDGRPSALDATG